MPATWARKNNPKSHGPMRRLVVSDIISLAASCHSTSISDTHPAQWRTSVAKSSRSDLEYVPGTGAAQRVLVLWRPKTDQWRDATVPMTSILVIDDARRGGA